MKKKLTAVLTAVLIVVCSVAGTLAYLTDSDSVVNTFTVGQVHITLDEAKVNADGSVVEGAERVNENEYHLIPGHTYAKDPTVTVEADSEECYVRMFVKVENIEALTSVLEGEKYVSEDGTFLLQTLCGGWDSDVWEFAGATGGNIYEFRYYTSVAKDDEDTVLEPLFTTITLPGEEFGNEHMDGLAEVKINVYAQAVQKDGFATAENAWTAVGAPDMSSAVVVSTMNDFKAAMTAGGTVKLADNIDMSGNNLKMDTGVDTVLDLNGKTLTVTQITLYNGSLTVKGNGTITGSGENAIYMYGGNLIIENGTFKNSADAGCVVYAKDCYDSYVTIKDGVFENAGLYCIRFEVEKLTIEGGTFRAEQRSVSLGSDTTAEITGGTFEDWVTLNDGCTMTITGGTFEEAFKSKGSLIIKDGIFNFNLYDPFELLDSVTITGGTFAKDPSESSKVTIPEGYKVTDNGNGKWTVSAQ